MNIWKKEMLDVPADHLATSDFWQELSNYRVLDPDGWNRQDFQYSWYEEQITAEEFEHRLMNSTMNWLPAP